MNGFGFIWELDGWFLKIIQKVFIYSTLTVVETVFKKFIDLQDYSANTLANGAHWNG